VEELDTPQLVVDTDIVIDYLRQRSTVLQAAIVNYDCALTAITLYELSAVAQPSERQQGLIQQIQSLVKILPLDESAAVQAADIWRTLASSGQIIGLPDIFIAGICLANDLPILTRNIDHYSRVAGLKIVGPDTLLSQIAQQ
jgi:tRNA(fMet)-specific endonuclease VapC